MRHDEIPRVPVGDDVTDTRDGSGAVRRGGAPVPAAAERQRSAQGVCLELPDGGGQGAAAVLRRLHERRRGIDAAGAPDGASGGVRLSAGAGDCTGARQCLHQLCLEAPGRGWKSLRPRWRSRHFSRSIPAARPVRDSSHVGLSRSNLSWRATATLAPGLVLRRLFVRRSLAAPARRATGGPLPDAPGHPRTPNIPPQSRFREGGRTIDFQKMILARSVRNSLNEITFRDKKCQNLFLKAYSTRSGWF